MAERRGARESIDHVTCRPVLWRLAVLEVGSQAFDKGFETEMSRRIDEVMVY